jgi:taurine-pyruvate aminotransferase
MTGIKESIDYLTKDKDHLWHSMKAYSPDSTMIAEKAAGSWVTDHSGKKYLDAMSGLWCVNVGYGRTELAEAAYEQLKEMAYFPLTQSHKPAILLAEKLNEMLGEEYVIFFSNSGSEANEAAFKIVRQYHQQKGDSTVINLSQDIEDTMGTQWGLLPQQVKHNENTNTNHWLQDS